MAVDPANDRARKRSRGGHTRELSVARTDIGANPARGGSRGYDFHFRAKVLAHAAHHGVGAAAVHFGIDASTVYRWGHRIIPHRMTGGAQRRNLTGEDQLLMVVCYFIWPDATPDEVRCFIFNNTEGDHLYSCEDVVKRANELGIFRKRASTEAYQAFSPENLLRCQLFWFQPPPLGVLTIRRSQFIDIDEFGMEITRCNRKYGRADSGLRVRKPGHYTRTEKVTVILAVEAGDPNVPDHCLGSVAKPRVWHRILRQSGMNQVEFSSFVDFVCRDFEVNPAPNGTDHHRVFLWDNLATHLTDLVYDTVELRPSPNMFQIVRRIPYQPKFGPTEYSINEAVQTLQRDAKSDWTTDTLVANIERVFTSGFGWNGAATRRFIHCGYEFD
jgi:hypothetical protein